MAGNQTIRRRVKRSVRGSKKANTLNMRGYRVAGQVFSRLLFPHSDIKELLPPMRGQVHISAYPNLFERKTIQQEVSDYSLDKVKVKLLRGKWSHTVETGPDGEFRSSVRLKLGRRYRLIVYCNFKKKGFTPVQAETIIVSFRATRRQIAAQKRKDRQARERASGKKSPLYSEIFNVVELRASVRHFTTQLKSSIKGYRMLWDRYRLKVPLYWSGGGRGTLWFGGNASLLLNTFVLNVPYLSQKKDTPKKKDLQIRFKKPGQAKEETWYVPVNPIYACLSTCMAMVLRYYGVKVSVKLVMEKASWQYLYEARNLPRYGLHEDYFKSGILQLSEKKGAYPYCIAMCVIKAGERILREAGVAKREIVTGVSQLGPIADTWQYTRFLLGAGVPVIGISRGDDDREGASELLELIDPRDRLFRQFVEDMMLGPTHAVVIRGLTVNSKGEFCAYYCNDPNVPVNQWPQDFSLYTGAQIILAKRLGQKDISPSSKRLMYGGSVPPAGRQLQPSERIT
jgi:hypothetical protein